VVLMRLQTQELGTCFGARHGGSSVAAERRRRARGKRRECQKGRGAEVERARGDAWKRNSTGGGARGTTPAVTGDGRSREQREAARARGKRSRGCQGDLFAILKKLRDPTEN
jgi:IS5 family transposase